MLVLVTDYLQTTRYCNSVVMHQKSLLNKDVIRGFETLTKLLFLIKSILAVLFSPGYYMNLTIFVFVISIKYFV